MIDLQADADANADANANAAVVFNFIRAESCMPAVVVEVLILILKVCVLKLLLDNTSSSSLLRIQFE